MATDSPPPPPCNISVPEFKSPSIKPVIKVKGPPKPKFTPSLTHIPLYFLQSTLDPEIKTSESTNKWFVQPFTKRSIPKTTLKIVTWNIYFDFQNTRIHTRGYKPLIDELIRVDADIICLQEATPSWMFQIIQSPLASKYFFSDINGKTIGRYGVVIMTKYPTSLFIHNLPTIQGRNLLLLEYNQILFGTVHLESYPKDQPIRINQLEISTQFMKTRNENCFLMGDFNFPDHPIWNNLKETIPKPFQDLWLLHKTKEEGMTFDPVVNDLTWGITSCRLDRMAISLPLFTPDPSSLSMIGLTPVCPGKDPKKHVYPSDHFGIQVQITYNGTIDPELLTEATEEPTSLEEFSKKPKKNSTKPSASSSKSFKGLFPSVFRKS